MANVPQWQSIYVTKAAVCLHWRRFEETRNGREKISEALCVTGQPQIDGMASLAQLGCKAVACNRPEGEAAAH